MWLLSMLLPGLLLATNACSPSDEQVKNAEPTPVPDQKPNPDSDPQPENAGGFDLPKGTNGNAPTVKLSSGYDMPILGLGTYSLHGATCVNSVKAALTVGFRKIDTASIYGNEEEVGQGVRESGVRVRKYSWLPNSTPTSMIILKLPLRNVCANLISGMSTSCCFIIPVRTM